MKEERKGGKGCRRHLLIAYFLKGGKKGREEETLLTCQGPGQGEGERNPKFVSVPRSRIPAGKGEGRRKKEEWTHRCLHLHKKERGGGWPS